MNPYSRCVCFGLMAPRSTTAPLLPTPSAIVKIASLSQMVAYCVCSHHCIYMRTKMEVESQKRSATAWVPYCHGNSASRPRRLTVRTFSPHNASVSGGRGHWEGGLGGGGVGERGRTGVPEGGCLLLAASWANELPVHVVICCSGTMELVLFPPRPAPRIKLKNREGHTAIASKDSNGG